MRTISLLTGSPYGGASADKRYTELIKILEREAVIEKIYGMGFPLKYKIQDEPIEKMVLTKVCTRIAYIVGKLSRFLGYPRYYAYWTKMRLLDNFFCRKIAKDASSIVFTNPLFYKTVQYCKKAGKYVVVEAGNSEPQREHDRVKAEYEKYGIKHRYIYGDKRYKNAALKGLNNADKIISISHFSYLTYKQAGYDMDKFVLIPLTGSNFKIEVRETDKKPYAFISTAVHNFIKGTHVLLQAWKKAGINDIPLIIVGTVCEDIEEFVKKTGPYENVVFAGSVDSLQELYSKYYAVGVQMSLSEGAIRVTPEMMSFGFPMITSPDAACDIVRDGENGFIINTNDEDELIRRLKWFDEDKSRFTQFYCAVTNSVNKRSTVNYSQEVGEFLVKCLNEMGK